MQPKTPPSSSVSTPKSALEIAVEWDSRRGGRLVVVLCTVVPNLLHYRLPLELLTSPLHATVFLKLR